MLERTVVVQNPEGLHARPAARLVQAASRFTSQVELAANGKTVSAKSIVAVLRLGVRQGESITIRASGLTVGAVTYSNPGGSSPVGTVLGQNPAPGQQVDVSSNVTMVVRRT